MGTLVVFVAFSIGVSLACATETPSSVPPTSVKSYLSSVSTVLGSIVDARDAWQEGSFQRSLAIAGLLDDLDPVPARRAREAETLALDSLLGVLIEAMNTLVRMTPPKECETAHALIIEAIEVEHEGWEQLKVWYGSPPNDQLQERAMRSLAESVAIRDHATDELSPCVTNEPQASTATPIPLQELRQTAAYYASSGSVITEYLTTADSALETASIDSTMAIIQSFDAGAATLEYFWRFQDDVEALRLRFAAIPRPLVALEFDTLMRQSFGSAKQGARALVSGYEKYAVDRGLPTRDDFEDFAKMRGRGEALIKAAAAKAAEALEESSRILDNTLSELDRRDPSGEQRYVIVVDAFVDSFYHHRKQYNDGLERIGAQIRSATSETEHRRALQQAIDHLQDAHRQFRQDRPLRVIATPFKIPRGPRIDEYCVE